MYTRSARSVFKHEYSYHCSVAYIAYCSVFKGFKFLLSNDKSHLLTFQTWNGMDGFLMARTGVLCVTLNLNGEAWETPVPDISDNVTSVRTAIERIKDAFGPSESAGYSFHVWLRDKLGPLGTWLIRLLIPILSAFIIVICFCTYVLTCMKALMYR